jgi:hypothetical protein
MAQSDSDERRTSSHPSKKGYDQETTFIIGKYPESTDSVRTVPQLEKMTVSRGEDKIASFPVPY